MKISIIAAFMKEGMETPEETRVQAAKGNLRANRKLALAEALPLRSLDVSVRGLDATA